MRKGWGTVVACAALCVTLSATPAEAAFPGQNGKIAFTGTIDGQGGIHAINPDGTDPTRLVGFGWAPAWSPSGTRIAFDCGAMLCVANADGSNQDIWYDEGSTLNSIDWAPDETKLALIDLPIDWEQTHLSWRVAQLEPPPPAGGVIDVDVQPSGAASWSPDGSRIAFVDGWQLPVGGIQTVAPDGAGSRQFQIQRT